MQIWAEPEKSALPICNYSQILYQFLTFTQNLKRSHGQNQKQAHTKSYQLCMCLNPFFVIRSDIFFNLMENNQGKHFHLN